MCDFRPEVLKFSLLQKIILRCSTRILSIFLPLLISNTLPSTATFGYFPFCFSSRILKGSFYAVFRCTNQPDSLMQTLVGSHVTFDLETFSVISLCIRVCVSHRPLDQILTFRVI